MGEVMRQHSLGVGLCLQLGGGGKTEVLGFHYEGGGYYGDCIQPKAARWQSQTVSRATSADIKT